jgi:C-terminal processing protease CtpA/Prc
LLSREQLSKLAEMLQGIPVWGCLPGSLGRNAGVRYGDVVLSVNGQPTSDVAAYLTARRLRNDGATMVVFRDGSTHTVQLRFEPTREAAGAAELHQVAQILLEARLLPEDAAPASSSRSAGHN